ncbi:ScbR family autoregulator-binding transcription factor [Kitasatospora sp. NPDC002227]|uniref:ScbR family autoregulator-binding transcription factor n=1 Tax=Kitasatospora sp. NPDC002227 TaxID=3154773 RepID=UPI00332E5247
MKTRREIIKAAAEVFERRGYAAATMAEIIAAAGVTKGAVYFHFASKEELAQAVIDVQSDWVDTGLEPAPGFQAVIDATMVYANALINDVIVRATNRLVIEHGSFDMPNSEPYQTDILTIRDLVIRADEAGDMLPRLDPYAVAKTITGAFTGIQLSSQVLSQRTDLVERLVFMWRVLLPGLVQPERLLTLDPTGSPHVRPRAAA